jgi:hypothetical protein
MLLLHVSALYERHLLEAQKILMKLYVCYVISAEVSEGREWVLSVCCQSKEKSVYNTLNFEEFNKDMDRDRRKCCRKSYKHLDDEAAYHVYEIQVQPSVQSIPCIWFIFSSKEHFCHLILITDPAQWGAHFTTKSNAWMFTWQQLGTWHIARFSVTQLIAQLSATLVDARPFTWFLQQQHRYGWFIWSYVVSQCNGLHIIICHCEGYNQTSGRTGKYLERLCD